VAIGTSLMDSDKVLSRFTWQGFLLLRRDSHGCFDRVDFCGRALTRWSRSRRRAAHQRVESGACGSRCAARATSWTG